jgi:hypothetical protein
MVVGHLTPGGMLACILSEAPADLEIVYLSSLSEEDVHGGSQSREMCETESQCQQVETGRLSLPSEKNRREQVNIKTGNIAH